MIKEEIEKDVEKSQFERKYKDDPCVVDGCKEYKYARRITRSFQGKFGTYLNDGFHVDFDKEI